MASTSPLQPGGRTKLMKWIHGQQCVLCVEVEAVYPADDPSEPSLEPDTVKRLDQYQRLADAGDAEALARVETVYARRVG